MAGNADAVVGAGAQRLFRPSARGCGREVVENGAVSVISTMKVLSPLLRVVGSAHAGKILSNADSGGVGGHEGTNLGQEYNEAVWRSRADYRPCWDRLSP
jgi:hypothetical protein